MKIIVDIFLFILMILEYSRMYMSPIWHEIIGITLIVLIIIHLLLNKNYIKNIFKVKYNLKRIIMLIINVLFITIFTSSSLFGLLSSEVLLTPLNIGSINIIRLHKTLAYISLLCMGLHLGVNISAMFGKIEKIINNKLIIFILTVIIIGLGIYSILDLDFWNHLTGKYGFSIVTGNIVKNIIEYLSIVTSIAILTNIIYKKIK